MACSEAASPAGASAARNAAAIDDVLARTVIPWRRVAAAVMHAKATPAVPAYGDALQQRCTFPHRASALMRAWTSVLRESTLVGFEGFPIDEAAMMVADEDRPLGAWAQLDALAQAPAVIDVAGLLRSTIDVDTGVEGVGEDLMDLGVRGRDPAHIGKGVRLQREAQALRAKAQPHAPRRAHLGKALEHRTDRRRHRLIGMQQHFAVRLAAYQTHRQPSMQLTACGLVADAAEQACTQDMEFGFRHRALEPQHQPIVEQARMIDAVGIADEGMGDAAQIEQTVPVGVVAGQARDLQSQHDSDLTEGHFSDHAGKTSTLGKPRARDPEVLVEDLDLIAWPAECHGAFGQLVLPRGGLPVVFDLGGARLAHVDHRTPAHMIRGDLAQFAHRCALLGW